MARKDAGAAAPVDWQSTACILCECNCGIVVQLDGRNLAKIRGDKAHPALAGLHLQQGVAARPLPEQPQPADLPHARRPDGSYEEIDWDTAIAEIAAGFKRIADDLRRGQDLLLRRRRAG